MRFFNRVGRKNGNKDKINTNNAANFENLLDLMKERCRYILFSNNENMERRSKIKCFCKTNTELILSYIVIESIYIIFQIKT